MVTTTHTITLSGIAATTVDVQVQISPGLAAFQVVGLPDNAVRESRERIRGALHAMGMALPAKRITVSLSPADVAKEGSHFDLPIAAALLMAMGILPADSGTNTTFMGELGLDGSLRPTVGALPAAIHALSSHHQQIFVPAANAPEAAWAEGLNIYGCHSLMALIKHLGGEEIIQPTTASQLVTSTALEIDFRDVKGQETVKRAAEIAAAGGHNLLMCGPPGSGKSMIAKRMATILPPLTPSEALEVSMIHSVAGMLSAEGLVTSRVFRDPHHSASAVALCGGGLKAKPGEMSLAHRGVLFLDELPEFPRQVLETLRQPLETGDITVSRANHHVTYPAKFQLIAAMNPSPCGYLGHPTIACSSSPTQIQAYRARLSGPLMDRIDIHVDVPAVDIKDLSLPAPKEGSAEIKARVDAARAVQKARFDGTTITTNSEMTSSQIDRFCLLSDASQQLLEKAATKYAMSARAYHRCLKVARTIADLDGRDNIDKQHLAEALTYRYIPYQAK